MKNLCFESNIFLETARKASNKETLPKNDNRFFKTPVNMHACYFFVLSMIPEIL